MLKNDLVIVWPQPRANAYKTVLSADLQKGHANPFDPKFNEYFE
jgi:hypothetical protein